MSGLSFSESIGTVLQIGFFALIGVEFAIGRGFLEAIGLKTGNGLPFEI